MRKPVITGIDIGHRSLKAVTLKPVGEDFALVGYKECLVDDGILSENHTLNHQEIVKTLKELKKELPRFQRQVAMAVPDNAVISKTLHVESDLEGREREFAIVQAFSHQSPFPVEDLYIDFVRSENDIGKGDTTPYQVVATKQEVVNSRVKAAEGTGLEPVIMDVHAHSLQNIWQMAVDQNPQKSKFALLDIGYNQSSLCIQVNKQPFFYKDFAFGTQYFDQQGANNPAADNLQAHNDVFNREIIERVKRQIQLFISINGPSSLQGIWLSGEGASTPLLVEELANQLKIECELFNPLGLFVNKVSKRKRRSGEWQNFSVAAGLAISGLNWLEDDHEL